MRKILAGVLVAAAVAGPGAVPGAAQDHRTGVGYGGGAMISTRLAPADGSGELKFDPTWTVGAQAEHWYDGGRIGLRGSGGYARGALTFPTAARDVDTWFADASVLLRVMPAEPGRGFAPFVSAGAGLVHYGLGRGPRVRFAGTDVYYSGDSQSRFAAVAGIGADIMTGIEIFRTPFGFRIEATDHVALKSPFENAAGEAFATVHHLRVSLSLFSFAGALY